jgi:predicted small lipoprotein YifL
VGRLFTVLLIVIAVGLTACGRRGRLEPPPSVEPDVPAPAGAVVQEPEEDGPFLLDWLIQ